MRGTSSNDVEYMRTYYVYKYTNKAIDEETGQVSNKIYVGQCFNINGRKRAHKSAAKKGSEACPLFYRAIRKHGYENFVFEIVETIYTDQKGIDARETYWIKELDARNTEIAYNISKGGGGRGIVENTDTHKKCPECNQIKLRAEYTKDVCSHDGVRYCCQVCGLRIDREKRALMTEEELVERRSFRREKYAENPEKYIEASKIYSADHKEERTIYLKQYNIENAEIIAVKNHERYIENQEDRIQRTKDDRIKTKEENSKLTKEQIFARTPLKFCKGECQKDIDSTNFYIDLTRIDALGNKCKDCHKKSMAINRAKNKATI